MDIRNLLTEAVRANASDLHLVSWSPPILRIDGQLSPLDLPNLTPNELAPMILSLLNEEQRKRFEREWELDLSLTLREVGRFRVNIHRQRGAIEAAFRIISEKIRSLRQLGMPAVIEELARKESGLILITGPTGKRQVHHNGGDDRSDQPRTSLHDRHHRRPDRIRLPQPQLHH